MTIAINFTKYIYGGVISMKRSYTALRKMLLTVTLIVVSSSSYASFMTGSKLNEWIYDYDRTGGSSLNYLNKGFLAGYVMGVVDLGNGTLFCLPANATAGQSVAYNLELTTASNKGYDALTETGLEVEIKATQSKSVAFRSQPQHTIIIMILRDGTFEEIYNGPGALVWDQFTGKRLPSNGQFQISLNKLRQLNQTVAQSDRVPKAI